MTRQAPDAFDALLARRDELVRSHTLACDVLEEMAAERLDTSGQYRKVSRLFDEMTEIQKRIDDSIAAERAAEERAIAEADTDPFLSWEQPDK